MLSCFTDQVAPESLVKARPYFGLRRPASLGSSYPESSAQPLDVSRKKTETIPSLRARTSGVISFQCLPLSLVQTISPPLNVHPTFVLSSCICIHQSCAEAKGASMSTIANCSTIDIAREFMMARRFQEQKSQTRA